MQIVIHTDGGARGNPGPAAIGIVIQTKIADRSTIEISKQIGVTTNNVAEYTAVVEALQILKEQVLSIKPQREPVTIQFYLDSNLVTNQLNGTFKVKDPTLRSLLTQVRILEQEVGGTIKYFYLPRERNRRADYLVNRALNGANRV